MSLLHHLKYSDGHFEAIAHFLQGSSESVAMVIDADFAKVDHFSLYSSSLVPPLVSYIRHHHQSTDHAHLAKPLRAMADLYPGLLQLLISCVADDKDFRTFAAHLQNF